MIRKKNIIIGLTAIGVVAGVGVLTPTSSAQTTANSQLTQQVSAGVLSTSIRNASGGVVATPAFAMSAQTASTSQQTSTGTFGAADRRITVDNPGGANGGWTLSLNATTPGTGTWTGSAGSYAYNGATAAAGQLTVNPSAAALTATIGGTTGVTLGTQATFAGTTSITLLTGAATAANIWNGYITGVGLSQTIPAGQAVGSYSLDVTQTVVAN